MWLADSTHADAVVALTRVLLSRRGYDAGTLQVRAPEYTWGDLLEWTQRALPILEMEGVETLDTDETLNRIRFRVNSEAARDAVLDVLEDYEVPAAAVDFEIGDPAVRLKSLNDRVRPVPGGGGDDVTSIIVQEDPNAMMCLI